MPEKYSSPPYKGVYRDQDESFSPHHVRESIISKPREVPVVDRQPPVTQLQHGPGGKVHGRSRRN